MFGFALSWILSLSSSAIGVVAIAVGAWLRSKTLALAGVAIIAAAATFTLGGQIARQESQEANLRAQLATVSADLAFAKAAADRARRAADELATQATDNRRRLDEYAASIEGRDPCTIGDDDARRLLELLRGGRPQPPNPGDADRVPPGGGTGPAAPR